MCKLHLTTIRLEKIPTVYKMDRSTGMATIQWVFPEHTPAQEWKEIFYEQEKASRNIVWRKPRFEGTYLVVDLPLDRLDEAKSLSEKYLRVCDETNTILREKQEKENQQQASKEQAMKDDLEATNQQLRSLFD